MASKITILTLLQLVALVCCISTADVKTTDNAEEVKVTDTVNNDDLETQETGWLLQEKMRQLEYLKNKIFSPFTSLKNPAYGSYGGGYPSSSYGGGNTLFSTSGSYSGGGGYSPTYSYSFGNNYPSVYSSKYQYKSSPFNFFKSMSPSYRSKIGYNKGYSSGSFQQGPSSYAPDCYYTTTSFKPNPSFGSATPPVSSGTPLYYYYTSTTPTQRYEAPLFDSTQSSTPAPASWSSVPAFYPSSPSLPASPGGPSVIGSIPSYPTVAPAIYPSTPAPPSWSLVSASYPSSPSFPSSPAGSSVTGSVPSYPTVGSASYPSTPAPPSWSSFPASYPSPPSSPQVPPIPKPSYIPSFSGALPASPSVPTAPYSSSQLSFSGYQSPVPAGQQYYLVPSSNDASVSSDQGSEAPTQEVVITPAPIKPNSQLVKTLPGPSVTLPEQSSLYNPGLKYAVSYYPNVFIISNEQYAHPPSYSQTSEEGQFVEQPRPTTTLSSTGTSVTETSSTAPETSAQTSKTQPGEKRTGQPVLTTFYSSNSIDQTRIPVVYTIQQPSVPPTSSGVFYSSPVIPNAYTAPLGYNYGASPFSVNQGVQTVPSSFPPPSVNSYPGSPGYTYGGSAGNFLGGAPAVSSTSAPC